MANNIILGIWRLRILQINQVIVELRQLVELITLNLSR